MINSKLFWLKGEGVAYRGRILFELSTVLGETPLEQICDIKHTEILRVEPLLHRKKYKLHAAFYDATMISVIDKSVEFEVSIGKRKVFFKFIQAKILSNLCLNKVIMEINLMIIYRRVRPQLRHVTRCLMDVRTIFCLGVILNRAYKSLRFGRTLALGWSPWIR